MIYEDLRKFITLCTLNDAIENENISKSFGLEDEDILIM